MNFLRNTIAVLLGLGIAGLIISFGIRINPDWITYERFSAFQSWENFLYSMKDNDGFFVFLLFLSGIGATIGGVLTAIVVKYAKVAYAILIGFILLFIAMMDVIVNPYHPTFYKILIFLTFFPFSWIGGKITEVIYDRKERQARKKEKKSLEN